MCGFLFDRFYSAVYFVLIPTGIIVCIAGLSAMNFFKNMEKEQEEGKCKAFLKMASDDLP